MFYDRTLLILTTRRNCQRGKLPACRAVIKRKGNAGECEVGWTSSSFAMSSSSFSSSPYTKTVFMPSRQGFAKGVAHDQQQVHRLQVPPLPQVSTTQLAAAKSDIHFAYIWSASVSSLSACWVVTLNILVLLSQGRHETRPCARRLPDQRKVASIT